MVATASKKHGRIVKRNKRSIASRTRSTRRITTLPGLLKGSYSLRLPTSSTKPAADHSTGPEEAATATSERVVRQSQKASGSPSSVDEVTNILSAKRTRTSIRANSKQNSYGKQYMKSGLWASTVPSSIPSPLRPSAVVKMPSFTGKSNGRSRSAATSTSGGGLRSSSTSKQSKGKGRESTTNLGDKRSGRSRGAKPLFTTTELSRNAATVPTIPLTPDSQPSTARSSSNPTASETSPKSVSSMSLSEPSDSEDSGSDEEQNDQMPSSFPPLPMYWGKTLISEERDFVLPWSLVKDAEQGVLDRKRTPSAYKQTRQNIYVERKPFTEEAKVICECAPTSGCRYDCLNRAMNYLCGKDCPSYPRCTNGSLFLRPQKATKVVFTGARGFGLNVLERVEEGDFIMDYRGEIIGLETYFNRIRTIYAGRKDFYALDYDMDEVIDAGQKGNDARFINHSCAPNIEVRKYQTAGAGLEEYEIGFWALRDIQAGEELCYNYNFDSFTTYKRPRDHPDSILAAVTTESRQRCFCGASNCSGWLGKRSGSMGESSNQPSGSKPPSTVGVVEKMKRGRPKGKGIKVGIKSQVIDNAKAESSKTAIDRMQSERIASGAPVSASKRKREEVIKPSRGAVKKLAQARKLAMEAAAECGISLERSNGHKRSVGQLGETARLARSICDELSQFHTSVVAAVQQARSDFPDDSSLYTTNDSDLSADNDILVVGSGTNGKDADEETFGRASSSKGLGMNGRNLEVECMGENTTGENDVTRDDRSENGINGGRPKRNELYQDREDEGILSRETTNGFGGNRYRDVAMSNKSVNRPSGTSRGPRGSLHFRDSRTWDDASPEQDADFGYISDEFRNAVLHEQPRAGPSVQRSSRARARSESSTYSSIEDDNESDWSSIGETEPAALSRPHAVDKHGSLLRRTGERYTRDTENTSGEERIERRGRPARNPAALRAAKVRALEQKGLPLTAALLEDLTPTDVKLAKAAYKKSDKVNAKQDTLDGARPAIEVRKKRRDRSSKVGKGKGGPPRSKPHPILAPQRMAQSRLALLNADGLEAERKARRQGPEWVEAQIVSLKQMHLGIASGEVRAPPEYIAPLDLDLWFTATPAPPKIEANTAVNTDITVFSLRLEVPFMNRSIDEWRHGLPGHRFTDWPQAAILDDDAETLVDPLDYRVYLKDVQALFEMVRTIKVEHPTSGDLPVDADQAPQDDSTAEQVPDEGDRPAEGEGDGEGQNQGDQPAEAPGGGSGSGNGGGDDGDGSKKGPPGSDTPFLVPTEEAEEEDEEERKRQAEIGQEEQPTAEASAAAEEGNPNSTEAIQAEGVVSAEPEQQWLEAMEGIVAMNRAQAAQENSTTEIGPEELAAAQLEIYRQEAQDVQDDTGSQHSSPGRDNTSPAFDHYDHGHYGSPSSAYGPDDYEGHDDDSFQRYIITHGLSIDEIEWSSVSDMTDLEEMEMNEREIVSTAPDMEKYNRSRRSRKPRPPRRFKTIITRIRPKLEAAITDVTPAEEDAALERERKRRKKGQAWLNSMKALAQARREAKARHEAGLPPPDFTLPPTSLTPTVGKKRVKKESEKADGDDQAEVAPEGENGTDDQSATTSKRKKSVSGKGRRRTSPPVAPLPAYDYHDGAENQQYLEALGQENYDTLLANQVSGHDGGVSSLPEDHAANQDYSALIQQAAEATQGVSEVDGSQHVDSFYQPNYDDVDNNPVSTLVQAANMFSSGQADAYMQNGNFDYSLQANAYSLTNFTHFGGAGEGSSGSVQLPPVPPIGRALPGSTYSTPSPGRVPAVSLNVTRTGEKRRRGPPVKKIAGAMLMPLTDEQWEAERKKRKKGFAWVQETKAAAEAERLARAQRAAGIQVNSQPRKQRGSNSGKSVEPHDIFGQSDDLYHTLEGHEQHSTLADAHQHLGHGGHPQDDIVPFPSTADDDFAMAGGLYQGQDQDMSHYADHTQNGNHYGDVGMN